MSEPLDNYTKLLNELILERAMAGGTLPDEKESEYVERLDALWWKLTEEERVQYRVASHKVQAPEDLGLVDCEVSIGSSSLPRKPVTGDG